MDSKEVVKRSDLADPKSAWFRHLWDERELITKCVTGLDKDRNVDFEMARCTIERDEFEIAKKLKAGVATLTLRKTGPHLEIEHLVVMDPDAAEFYGVDPDSLQKFKGYGRTFNLDKFTEDEFNAFIKPEWLVLTIA